jgi:4-aminobutyrate aminotransferase/(S)-3-amino-2-methylpropionate transaminase
MDRWPESKGEALHTSTFLGNPVACAAALAAIREMKRLNLNKRATDLGAHTLQHFGALRGKGLMLGLPVKNAPRLCEQLLRRGILALPEGERGEVLGITPPLTISERARLRELEKENRELKLEREFLGKAAAFFASEYR